MDSTKQLGIGVSIGVVAVLALVLVWFFLIPVLNWRKAQQMGKSNPRLLLVPQPLRDQTVSRVPGTKLAEFGYEFEVPWPEPETAIRKEWLADYLFPGGRGLVFENPAEQHGLIAAMKEATAGTQAKAVSLLGARSEYDLLNAELNITPDQVSPLFWTKGGKYGGTLLNLKAALCSPPAYPWFGVFSFQSNGLRGFQFGDPSRDHLVSLDFFDADDREFRFFLSMRKDSSMRFAQPELNRIIQTIRPTSAPSTN
ncbi:MAG TPA: hypothetical protein VLY23_08435 [Candidatus Acidoferrum sp.]|nr:hypothetical protein [Candidatus Acidoferrum sp.]